MNFNYFERYGSRDLSDQKAQLEGIKENFESIKDTLKPKSTSPPSLKQKIQGLEARISEGISKKKPTEIDKRSIKLQKSYKKEVKELKNERKHLNHYVKKISPKFDKITKEMNYIQKNVEKSSDKIKEKQVIVKRIKKTGEKIKDVGIDVKSQNDKLESISNRIELIENKKIELDNATKKRKDILSEITNSIDNIESTIKLNERSMKLNPELKEQLGLACYKLRDQQKKLQGIARSLKTEEFNFKPNASTNETWLMGQLNKIKDEAQEEVQENSKNSDWLRSLRPKNALPSEEKKASFFGLKIFPGTKKQEKYSEQTIDYLNNQLFSFASSIVNYSPEKIHPGNVYGSLERAMAAFKDSEFLKYAGPATKSAFHELERNFNKFSSLENTKENASAFYNLHTKLTEEQLKDVEILRKTEQSEMPRKVIIKESRIQDHEIGKEINRVIENINSSKDELMGIKKPFDELAEHFLNGLDEHLRSLDEFDRGAFGAFNAYKEMIELDPSFSKDVKEYQDGYLINLRMKHEESFNKTKNDIDTLIDKIKERGKLLTNIDATISRFENAKKNMPLRQHGAVEEKIRIMKELRTNLLSRGINFRDIEWRDKEFDFQKEVSNQLDPIRNERFEESKSMQPTSLPIPQGRVIIDSKRNLSAVVNKNVEVTVKNMDQFMKEALHFFKEKGALFPYIQTKEYIVHLDEQGELQKDLRSLLSSEMKDDLKHGSIVALTREGSKTRW